MYDQDRFSPESMKSDYLCGQGEGKLVINYSYLFGDKCAGYLLTRSSADLLEDVVKIR